MTEQKRILDYALWTVYALIFTVSVNYSVILVFKKRWLLFALSVASFVILNIIPGLFGSYRKRVKAVACRHAFACLYMFLVSVCLSVPCQIFAAAVVIKSQGFAVWIVGALICVFALSLLFWNGIIFAYVFGGQLGLSLRIWGIICGFIPVANLVLLILIMSNLRSDERFEDEKERINRERKEKQICKTKYPVLLVHGVFFRDMKLFNYWGRIPSELERNGADVKYGMHTSALSVAHSGKELAARIKQIVDRTECEKVNVIAHSKGGLDIKYAIAFCGISDLVASVITINSPHKGCAFADHLLTKVPTKTQKKIADTYNGSVKKLWLEDADFMAAVKDLTAESRKNAEEELKGSDRFEGIYCRSIGSVLGKASGGKFPLNFTYRLAGHFEGANDGLVSESSFGWGENCMILRPKGKRGISHVDMIDLNRENLPGFDVREFYVQLVSDLKNRGL